MPPVTLTSPALGHDVGFPHTGPEEDWLLAQGYARRDGYTGPGVSNTGPSDIVPAKDPTLAANREAPPARKDGKEDPGPLDPAMTFATTDDDPNDADVDYDFDQGGTNTEAPSAGFKVNPSALKLAGGAVTIEGRNLKGTTGVTVGGTAATSVAVVSDSRVTATFPAKTAGSYAVAVTNATGTTTESAAVTYAA